MDMENRMALIKAEEHYEWRKWCQEIPFIPFKADWLVQVIPPFCGAVARFRVAHKDKPETSVSVYLDCYDQLGYVGQPYWELYPAKGGDTDRFLMNEIDELVSAIADALNS